MSAYFYIKRTLISSPMWLEDRFSTGQAWLDLIALANYEQGHIKVAGQIIPIYRGQCGWSMERLADRWKWDARTVKKFLNRLQNEERITFTMCNRTTVINIVNYDAYQKRPEKHAEQNAELDVGQNAELDVGYKERKNKERIKKNSTPLPPKPGQKDITVELLRGWIEENITSPIDVETHLANFRDYEFKRPIKDWRLAAYNWLRTEQARYNERHPNGPRQYRQQELPGDYDTPSGLPPDGFVGSR